MQIRANNVNLDFNFEINVYAFITYIWVCANNLYEKPLCARCIYLQTLRNAVSIREYSQHPRNRSLEF